MVFGKGQEELQHSCKTSQLCALGLEQSFFNPKLQRCFKGEDFVGQMSRLTHSVSMGVSATRLSNKVAPKYRILVHLFLTRSMQAMQEGQDES